MKTVPELGDLIGRERDNHSPWLPEPETGDQDAMRSSITEWGSHEIGTLEVVRSCRQRMAGMELIDRAEHTEAMVDGLRSGFWFFVELIAHIIEQNRFTQLEQGAQRGLQPPPCEVQQIISVGAQRAGG